MSSRGTSSISAHAWADKIQIGHQHNWKGLRCIFRIWRWRDLNRPYDWTEDLLTEDSIRIENLVLFQCILSEQPFTSLHECGFIQSTGDQTVQVKWGGRRISHHHNKTRRTEKKGRWATIALGKFHSLKCLEWHWKRGMELRFPLEHRPGPPMQEEISGGTSVNIWLQSDCKESTSVRHIAISIGALVISVPAQLLHGGHQILFDAVPWPSTVDYLGPWCMFVMYNMCDSLDFNSWMRRSVDRKKSGFVDVPLGGGQYVPEKGLQGIDEGLRAFWGTLSTKIRLILMRYRELQIILKDLENFIKRLDTTFFV